MHEDQRDLDGLQRLLDESYERAGVHLKSIFTSERRITAHDLARLLRGVCVLHLATVTARGEPLVAPVDGLFFRGRFWFGSAESSVRFRHLRARPSVSATYTVGEDLCVLVHGRAIEVDKSLPENEAFREYNREVYGAAWDSWGYWASNPYALIEPRHMVAAAMRPEVLAE